jgi:hypothetical protein
MSMVDERWNGWDGMGWDGMGWDWMDWIGWIGNEVESCKIKGCI